MKFIMVLNDGETFTNLDGCAIIGIPDDLMDIDAIEEELSKLNSNHDHDLIVVTVFQDQA